MKRVTNLWIERRIVSVVLLLVLVLTSALTSAAGASTPASVVRQPSSSDPQPIRRLSATESGVVFEVGVPWAELSLERTTAGGREYVRVALPGWSSTATAGSPELPFLAQAVGAPVGAEITVRVTPGKTHDVELPAAVLPVAIQVLDWAPPAEGAPPSPPEPATLVEADAAVYAAAAAYPRALAQVTNDGMLRQQRVAGIGVYPVQYNPATQALTVYETLTVEVSFGDPGPGGRDQAAGDRGQAEESVAYEEIFQQELLNYEAARAWRTPNRMSAAAGEGVGAAAAAVPWAPPALGWRVKVQADGFYRLTYVELNAAGLPLTKLDPRTFKLYHGGSEAAIHVEGQADGRFDATDTILFYGQAVTSRYTRDNVYWLTFGGAQGKRMAARAGTPGLAATPAYYRATRRLENNAIYLPGVPGDETVDRWLSQDYINPPGRPSWWSTTFSLAAPYAGGYTARLKIAMLGGLDSTANPDHHTQIYVNGTAAENRVEDARWDGKVWRIADVTFSQSLLVAGSNTITVICPNDTGTGSDLVFIDWVELTFADRFVAVRDEAAFGNDAAKNPAKYQVTGFSNQQVAVYDVTDPQAIVRITDISTAQAGSTYTAAFQDTAAAGTQYWALTDAAYRTVQAIELDAPSNLAATANGADWIVITHAAFAVQAGQLASHRRAQGLRTAVVDVQDVYDEFAYGIVSPAATRDFLKHAYSQWQAPAPSYVVLVGDGHYDPKNYLGYGRTNYLPAYLAPVDPWQGETAADNRYVTVSGTDNLPDMLLGRLSVNSAADASALVNKIIAYENTPPAGAWQQRVLSVADNTDGAGNFAQMSDVLLTGYLPAPYTAIKVYYGITHTTTAAARSAIQAGINAGALIVNYVGHGAPNAWTDEGLFKTTDIANLTNGAMLPVMLPMTCNDGFYHYPYPLTMGLEALGEMVTRVADNGAVASWSPAGFGVATGHDVLNRGFFTAIFTKGVGTVGAGTAAGKLALYATGVNLDLLDTYLLFGDPATRMPTACAQPAAVNDVKIARLNNTEVQLGWSPAGGALMYQVWWKANNFYFTPGAVCTEANGCAWRSTPSFTHVAGLGNTGANTSYVVLPVSACGAVQSMPSRRIGEFDFALAPGN